MGKKVLSLGAIAMDYMISSHELPKDDGFGFISHEEMIPGGSAANVSVSCAGLGMEVYQTGKIGDDVVGDRFRETLVADGVDDRFLVTRAGGTTLHTYIISAPGGKHCIFANPGDTVCTLVPEELPKDMVEGMDIFYNDMFSPKAAIYLAKQAVSRGIPVVYNMQCVPSFMEICGTNMEEIREMMELCTVFVSGRAGYEEMTGEQDPFKAMHIIQDKYKVKDGVILTAGGDGSYWYDGDKEYYAPAYKVEAVNTTGAGDCYIGGLLYAYFDEGQSKADAMRFANATAAVKCTIDASRSRASVEDIRRLMGNAR